MFGLRRSRPQNPAVQPDLPITPMLDMSFQLMAFFILTFRPMPVEGQLPLALPEEGSRGPVVEALPIPSEPEAELVVRVYATEAGRIADIRAMPLTGEVAFGADTARLYGYLRGDTAGRSGKPARLKFEFDGQLNYQFVTKLLDEGRRAGYDRISPRLLDRM